jgi:palmitoyltransferase ZDHHC13/17
MSATPSQALPVPASAKANAASPKVTSEDVELGPVQNGQPVQSIPLEEDIMQCARIGAIEHIQKMIESGKVSAKYQDEEGITPLHWAAINNQYAICKYLVEQGADVNAKGGESGATPAMWAAQRCHYYIVNLLLENGADPLAADGQGYNILHLATIDGNAMLLILLLHQNIPVDVPDPQGHTSLMWAGYKGWPALVDLLLKWSASVNATDDNGFTPLHWALVKGSKPCIERLIEYGADRFAKTNDGKTPATCADEMNTMVPYRRALKDQGYGPDGHLRTLPLNLHTILRNRSTMSKFYFLWPFLIIFSGLYIISNYSIYVSVPVTIALSFAMQYLAQYAGTWGSPDFRQIHKTPYLAGVFAGTVFWLGVTHLTRVLPVTWSSFPFANLLFIALYASTVYFYYLAMTADPGFVPKLPSRNQQRSTISELFSLWKFDEDTFCIHCMIRKPLRSKHCRRCGRCVAKQDHHCPWINNCVANNNIRHFFIYILSMEIGIVIYLRLVLAYLPLLPKPAPEPTCNILSSDLCTLVVRDTWTVALTVWTLIQLVWITMLIVVQSIQISKNMTTYENMRRHSHNDHNHPALPLHRHHQQSSISAQPTSSLAAAPAPVAKKPDSFLTKLARSIGLDVFMATASDARKGTLNKNPRSNPFSRGVIGNCKDFWCDPAPVFRRRGNGESYLGGEVVNYTKMYDVPLRVRRVGGMRYEGLLDGEGRGDGDDDEV